MATRRHKDKTSQVEVGHAIVEHIVWFDTRRYTDGSLVHPHSFGPNPMLKPVTPPTLSNSDHVSRNVSRKYCRPVLKEEMKSSSRLQLTVGERKRKVEESPI